MNTILALLQNRNEYLQSLQNSKVLTKTIYSLIVINLILFGIYGLIIGISHSFPQALSAMVKLPLLFLITTVICFPTLFIFNSLFGAKLNIQRTFVYLLTGNAIMSIIILAFSPVTLFFLITSNHYQFFKILNVLFFAIAGFAGANVFYKILISESIKTESKTQSEEADKESESNTNPLDKNDIQKYKSIKVNSRQNFLFFWILLYGFVGSQLAWTLRPFLGSPGLPFEIFRELGGNFYTNIIQSIGHVLGFH